MIGRCFIPVMEPPIREAEPVLSPTVEELHLLIENMGDEIDSYRRREAAWVSLVVHGVIIAALIFVPKWLPQGAYILPVKTPQDATFLALPESLSRKPPKSNFISDQDRVAQTRIPAPSKELIRKLIDARRPGPPDAATPPPTPQQVAQAAPDNGTQQPAGSSQQQPPANQTAQLSTPPQGSSARNPFAVGSPGSSVSQAIQSVAANRANSNSGYSGDYGAAPVRPRTDQLGNIEILSDTQGVDFGPYMKRLHVAVQGRWDVLIPQAALPPIMKKGVVVLQFAILKDGTVTGLQIVRSSGDESLDRAAYGAITTGNLPQLPQEFTGPYLMIRAAFYYNPDRGDFQ